MRFFVLAIFFGLAITVAGQSADTSGLKFIFGSQTPNYKYRLDSVIQQPVLKKRYVGKWKLATKEHTYKRPIDITGIEFRKDKTLEITYRRNNNNPNYVLYWDNSLDPLLISVYELCLSHSNTQLRFVGNLFFIKASGYKLVFERDWEDTPEKEIAIFKKVDVPRGTK